MRVALLVSSYHPQIGGVETHVRRIAQGCAAAGHSVTVLTHETGTEPAEEWISSVRVLRFPLTLRSATYPLSLKLFRYLREHAAEFDLVHAHSYHTLVGQAAGLSGLPFVFTPHYHGTGHTSFRALLHKFYRPVGARLFARANAVICVSEAERAIVVQDFPWAAEKVRAIPNGTDRREPLARPEDAADNLPVILTIGRLERYKNVDLIIDAFRALRHSAILAIVGDGPDRLRLEQIAGSGEAGERVEFLGRVSDQVLAEQLAEAAVVVSASDHEAFGLILADGMAAGARVVASGIPAHREVGALAGPAAPITFTDPRQTAQFTAALETALGAGPVPAGSVHLPSWEDVVTQTCAVYALVRAGGHQDLAEELV